MTQRNQKTNWKALAFIGICSVALGGIIDQLLQFDNSTFLISGYLPFVMIALYVDYVTDDSKGINILKPNLKGFINKWRHRLFPRRRALVF